MENYLEQAKNFLKKTNTTFSIEFVKSGKYLSGDKDVRDIYRLTLKRGNRTYTSDFGQSLNNSGILKRVAPTEYDVLACLTKYDPDTFDNFCSEFGYSNDSRNAEKIYNGVCKEYAGVCSLWNDDEIEELIEIY